MNKCNLKNVIYQGKFSTNEKAYVGIPSLKCKFWYYNQLQSFKNPTLKKKLPYVNITGIWKKN